MKIKAGTFAAMLADDQLSKLSALKIQLAEHPKPTKQSRRPPSPVNDNPDWVHQFVSEVLTDLSVASNQKKSPKDLDPTHLPKTPKQPNKPERIGLKNDAILAVRRPAQKHYASKVDRVIAIAEVMHPAHKHQELDLLIKSVFEKHAANPVDEKNGKLKLKVKRGSILQSKGYCSVCLTTSAPLTRYADSNYGPVVLCSLWLLPMVLK